MHVSGVIASAILIASAQATTVRVVKVGSSNGGLGFSPSNTQAKPGDVVQFQFMPGVRYIFAHNWLRTVLT